MNENHDQNPADELADSAPFDLPRKSEGQSQIDFEIEFFGRVVKQRPTFVDAWIILGNNLSAKGDIRRVIEVDRMLTRLLPDDPKVHLNLARDYALTRDLEQSLQCLQRAVELGFDDLDQLLGDQDFESLRGDERFFEIVSGIGIISS